MNRKKPEPNCNCEYCLALSKQVNRDELFTECGFYFHGLNINNLPWRTQVSISKVRELYSMPMNGSTVFFAEKSQADYVTTASADMITAITGAAWEYVTCIS